jgi:cytochrome c oxidase cbb3-type subunit III
MNTASTVRAASALALALTAPAMADTVEDGRLLYAVYCAQCHGIEGNGHGVNVEHMSVMPRDHTNRSEMGGRSDQELLRVIRDGGQAINQSVLMPAWKGNLDEEQMLALVRYLRVLCCEDNEGSE